MGNCKQNLRKVRELATLIFGGSAFQVEIKIVIWEILRREKIYIWLMWNESGRKCGKGTQRSAKELDHIFSLPCQLTMLNIFSCVICRLFDEVSVQVFANLEVSLLVYLLLSFESSLYILDTNRVLDMYFANTFSQLIICLFIL